MKKDSEATTLKSFWHKSFGIIISICLVLILFIFNKFVPINVMLSKNSPDILKSTITFTSIVIGLSGTLVGQVISAKNCKNEFVVWYFEKVDKSTFIFNIMAGTISAFILIGASIFLLSYEMLSDILRRIATLVWVCSLSAFIIYQISDYKLFLDILFFKCENNVSTNKPSNISDTKKKELFNASKNKAAKDSKIVISTESLIDNNQF